jgi:hypothetical protein
MGRNSAIETSLSFAEEREDRRGREPSISAALENHAIGEPASARKEAALRDLGGSRSPRIDEAKKTSLEAQLESASQPADSSARETKSGFPFDPEGSKGFKIADPGLHNLDTLPGWHSLPLEGSPLAAGLLFLEKGSLGGKMAADPRPLISIARNRSRESQESTAGIDKQMESQTSQGADSPMGVLNSTAIQKLGEQPPSAMVKNQEEQACVAPCDGAESKSTTLPQRSSDEQQLIGERELKLESSSSLRPMKLARNNRAARARRKPAEETCGRNAPAGLLEKRDSAGDHPPGRILDPIFSRCESDAARVIRPAVVVKLSPPFECLAVFPDLADQGAGKKQAAELAIQSHSFLKAARDARMGGGHILQRIHEKLARTGIKVFKDGLQSLMKSGKRSSCFNNAMH